MVMWAHVTMCLTRPAVLFLGRQLDKASYTNHRPNVRILRSAQMKVCCLDAS